MSIERVTVFESIDKYNCRTKSFSSTINHGVRVLRNIIWLKDNYDGRVFMAGDVTIKGKDYRVTVSGGCHYSGGHPAAYVVSEHIWNSIYKGTGFHEVA